MQASEWAPRRFWQQVGVAPVEGGYAVMLDDRQLHTPGQRLFVAPSSALAHAVALEWQAWTGAADSAAMPFTAKVNAALDQIADDHAAVAGEIAKFAESDLLCHRAAAPDELVSLQAGAWDPLLAWATEGLDAPLATGVGVIPINQPAASLTILRNRVNMLSEFELVALAEMVTLSGSLIIGLAAMQNQFATEKLWQAARIDETWQHRQWGADKEEEERLRRREQAFMSAHRFLALLQDV